MEVIVIGGGAAGMIAAARAAESGNTVTLIEKNEKLGKKIYITGKGRCNVTNADTASFADNVIRNFNFMRSAFSRFDSNDTIELLERYGVKTKIERGNRVFPCSDKASDVTKALSAYMLDYGVNILLNTETKNIVSENGNVTGVNIINADGNKQFLKADKVILATGGQSYKATGSTGDGYRFARALGHNIITPKPSLVGLNLFEGVSDLAGVTLKNVQLKIVSKDCKPVYLDFGELLFTHTGISGPIVLTASSKLNNIDISGYKAIIDLKPKLDEQQLDKRILSDFEKTKNKMLKNALDELIIKALQHRIIKSANIDGNRYVNCLSKEERKALVKSIKNLTFTIKHLGDIDTAIITSGGIDTKQINPKSMQSKLINGLYFAGEVIDVDALTGGYNMQIALSSGYLAGLLVEQL